MAAEKTVQFDNLSPTQFWQSKPDGNKKGLDEKHLSL
jgi:hypothetical protein